MQANRHVISRSAVPPIINQRRNDSFRCLIDNGFTPFAESAATDLSLEARYGTEIKETLGNITFHAEIPPW